MWAYAYGCYFLFNVASVIRKRIATRIVALTLSIKKYYGYEFGEYLSSNPLDLVAYLYGWCECT